jgi:hypothetical protein
MNVKQQFDNSNRGALFRNDNKSRDTDADYAGTINAAGVEYWINGWIKTSAKGTKYMSLSIKPKETTAAAKAADKRAAAKALAEDEVPF